MKKGKNFNTQCCFCAWLSVYRNVSLRLRPDNQKLFRLDFNLDYNFKSSRTSEETMGGKLYDFVLAKST